MGQLEPALQATSPVWLLLKVVAKGANGTAIAQPASIAPAVSATANFTILRFPDVSGSELSIRLAPRPAVS